MVEIKLYVKKIHTQNESALPLLRTEKDFSSIA